MSTIKEEAIKLRNNIDAVYEAGKAAGNNYDKGYEEGYEDGKNSVADYFQYANTLNSVFSNIDFPTDTELYLYLPMLLTKSTVNNTILNNAFNRATGLKSVKLKCEVRDVPINYYCAFFYIKSVKLIDLSEFNTMVSDLVQTFAACNALEEIKGEFDFSQCTRTTDAFKETYNLIEVRFKANTLSLSVSLSGSPNLSAESIQSIIDGLADLTGGTAQTVSWHTTVLDKLTEAQTSLILSKNWAIN